MRLRCEEHGEGEVIMILKVFFAFYVFNYEIKKPANGRLFK